MGLWGDIITGAAGAVGFAFGGPVGAAVLGGVVGGVVTGFETGWDPEKMLEGAAFGAVGGLVGGAVGGIGAKAFGAAGRSLMGGSLRGGVGGLFGNGFSRAAVTGGWDGAQAGLQSVRGLIGAGLGASGGRNTPDMVRDKWHQYMGYPEIEVIDISNSGIKDTSGMPHVYMPDPAKLPDGLTLLPAIQGQYKGLPDIYLGNWKSFGNGKESALPEKRPVGEVSNPERANIESYPKLVENLDSWYEGLRGLDVRIVKATGKTSDLCKQGRKDVGGIIESLTEMAKVDPRSLEKIQQFVQNKILDASILQSLAASGLSEDTYVMTMIESTMMNLTNVMSEYANAFDELGKETEKENPAAVKPAAVGAALGAKTPAAEQNTGNPYSTYVPPSTVNGTPAATSTGDQLSAPPAWEWDSDSGSQSNGSATDTGSSSTATDPASTKAATGTDSAGVTSPTSTPTQSAASPASSMGSDFMLPYSMMQQALANRGNAVHSNSKNSDDHRGEREGTPETVAGAPVSPAQTPQTAQQTSSGPAATTAASPGRVSATPVSAVAASMRTPDGDGSVVYTFPDGRTQRVSAVVAQALDAAFGNAAGTDARAAYGKTPVTLPADRAVGAPVDPYQLMTGDVATWEHRSAIAVSFGSDSSGTLEVIIDGQLQPFTAEMRDSKGEFGPFGGFFHPAGIEITAPAPDAAAPMVPVDQPVGGSIVVPA
ncbi:hypothetical protein OHB12_31900 [Nocardia sp. NBC_01730]|uniref:hypothetical protein n=1 Tax=Nocardia sp. NBC_01730 TaxID=2975998 RepID=UPI002E155DDE|nr:hypothetical protein OHB12_31900 [Nocardia sp. NBC_01730]